MATNKWLEENREYVLNYHKEYNLKHPERQKKYREKVKKWFYDYKATLRCLICGENNSVCLDFHHRNPNEKDGTVNQIYKNHWGIKRIKKEIDKCDVVCSNCHRKIHYGGIVKAEKEFYDGMGI